MQDSAKLVLFVLLAVTIISGIVFSTRTSSQDANSQMLRPPCGTGLNTCDIDDFHIGKDKLFSSQRIDETYHKKGKFNNSLLFGDTDGNIVDSGITADVFQACCKKEGGGGVTLAEIDAKYVKKSTAPGNALLVNDANGNLVDSGITTNYIQSLNPAAASSPDALLKSDIVDTITSTSKLYSSSKIDGTYQKKIVISQPNKLLTVDGTGAVVDSGLAVADTLRKGDIVDTSTSTSKLYSSSKIDTTYAKKSSAPANALLMNDATGNLVDSGITPSYIQSCCAQASTGSTNGLTKFDIVDTSTSTSKLYSSDKIDSTYVKKSSAPANTLLMNDANGNLVDSGITPTYIQSCCAQSATGSTNGLLKSDIVDTSVSTSKLFSSSKIDGTYQKKTTAPVGALVMPDASGNLVDSGLTPTFINACCSNANDAVKKTDIVDSSTSTTKLYSSSKIDTTYAKKSSAPANALLMNDATGNLVDSGITPSYIQSCCAQAATGSTNGLTKFDIVDTYSATNKLYSSNKIETTFQKKTTAPAYKLLMPDNNGNLIDSGLTVSTVQTCCTNAESLFTNALFKSDIIDTTATTQSLFSSSKIDTTYAKKSKAPANTLLMNDASGNLVDSGLTPTYIQACCAQAATGSADGLRKADIVDTSSAKDKLYSSDKIETTFMKKTTAPANSLLMPDANGNLVDSGVTQTTINDLATNALKKTDIVDKGAPATDKLYSSSKIDSTYQKKTTAPANAILVPDASGNLVDSGLTPTFINACCTTASAALKPSDIVDTSAATDKLYSSSKIDTTFQKRTTAPANALLMPDANGNLVDSGLTPTYIQSCCTTASTALKPSDIVDTSLSTSKLYSSSKIDSTYTKKSTAPANSLLMNDANGNLVDSGLTPTYIQSCCAQAATGSTNGLMKSDIVDTSSALDKLYSSTKIETTFAKKSSAPANTLLMNDATGNLIDSGLTPTYIQTCCNTASAALKQADIVDTSTSTSKLYSSSKIDATYQKKTTAPANSLLMPDASGNLVDSGLTPTFINTCCTNASNAASAISNSLFKSDIVDTSVNNAKLYSSSKIDATYQKKTTAPANALLMPDASGNLIDSGLTPTFINTCCSTASAALKPADIVDTSTATNKLYSSSKIDATYQKKTTAPANALLMPDASGNLVDSGLTPTFINTCCTNATNALKQADIVDTSTSTSKLYSSSKIDATYQKKTTAPVNSLLMPDASGNLVDSGLTPTFINTCCTNASNAASTISSALLKSDIVDTNTSTTKLYSSSKIDATYQKKTTAPANALLMPDSSGNLVDSGLTPTFINTCCTNASNALSATNNSLLKSDIADTSTSTTKLYSSSKIDATYQKKTTAPANALLMPDASGNLVDSGLTPTFINTCCTNASNAASAISNSLLKSDIVDTSTSTTKLYSSSKIDATYQKKTTAPANTLLMPDASGNLVDSGLTPTFINTCCTNAANALKQADIVDTSTATNKLYSSSKIDATYQKKTTAPSGSILSVDASGNLVNAGITSSQLATCCASTSTFYYLQYTMVFAYFNAVPNSWTRASYFTKRYDNTPGWHANGKFTPKIAGVWSIRATAWCPRTLGGNRIHFALAQNDSQNPLWQDVNSWNNSTQSNLTTFTAKVDAIFVLNGTTDYVSAYFMTNALNQDFDVLENCNMFQAYYLGEA